MSKKMLVLADEVEVGDMVHHPDWVAAPSRVGAVECIIEGRNTVQISVAGVNKLMIVRKDEHVRILKP